MKSPFLLLALPLLFAVTQRIPRPKVRATFDAHDFVNSVAYSPDANTLAAGVGQLYSLLQEPAVPGQVILWDTKTGKRRATFGGHKDGVTSVAFTRDGHRLASGSFDWTVKLRDPSTGRELSTLTIEKSFLLSLAFSPDGKTLATGSWNDDNVNVHLWDVVTGQVGRILKGHSDGVTSVAFSPDGRSLATGSMDETAKVWDVETGTVRFTIKHEAESWIFSVAFSPDGKRLATAGGSPARKRGEVKLWDTVTGENATVLKGMTNVVSCVTFSPDGKTLAAAGMMDGTVKLWDVASGELRSDLMADTSRRVNSVAYSPDGGSLATGGVDGTAIIWELSDVVRDP